MGLTALNLVLIDILRNICEISSRMHYTSFILKQISLIPFDTFNIVSYPAYSDVLSWIYSLELPFISIMH